MGDATIDASDVSQIGGSYHDLREVYCSSSSISDDDKSQSITYVGPICFGSGRFKIINTIDGLGNEAITLTTPRRTHILIQNARRNSLKILNPSGTVQVVEV